MSLTHQDLIITGTFNDDFPQHEYPLLALVAKHAVNGPFGAVWADTDPTTAEVCIASGGGLFLSRGKPALFSVDLGQPPPIDPTLSRIEPKFFTNPPIPLPLRTRRAGNSLNVRTATAAGPRQGDT